MNFEQKFAIKEYKKFCNYSFKSRYDNGSTSYFKYYNYENLTNINYLSEKTVNQIQKQINYRKKEKMDKIFTKQKNLDIIYKYNICN